MDVSKAVFATFLISLFILQFVHNVEMVNSMDGNSTEKIDCGMECKRRCSKASRHKACIRACGTCCAHCNCVPPGTSGNIDVCPCYANMTTHGGRRKCP